MAISTFALLLEAQKRGHNSAADSEHERSREAAFEKQVHR